MIVPGSNLLNAAFALIARQSFLYIAYDERLIQTTGMYVPEYAAGVMVTGSVQAVPRTLFERMGLDFQKNYSTFFVPQAIQGVDRATTGDRFYFNNRLWQVQSTTEWVGVDGWDEALCVQVPVPNNYYITETGFLYCTEDGSQFYEQES